MPNPTLDVHRHRVVPLVTFESANPMRFETVSEDATNPDWVPYTRVPIAPADAERPPLDYLGMPSSDAATVGKNVGGVPAVALTAGEAIYVRLRRVGLASDAALTVRVDDVTVQSEDARPLAHGRVPAGDVVTLRLSAAAAEATLPAHAAGAVQKLEIRLGDSTVGALAIRVYPRLTMRVRVHRINAVGRTYTPNPASFPDLPSVTTNLNAIWRQAGVRFNVEDDPGTAFNVTHDPAWIDNWNEGTTDLPQLLALNEARKVNVYFLRKYGSTDGDHAWEAEWQTTMGNTYSLAPWAASLTAAHPAIFVFSLRPDGTSFLDAATAVAEFSTMLAHEIGHYFGMHHPRGANSDDWDILGAQMLLMNNTSPCGHLMPVGARHDAPRSEQLFRSGSADARAVALREQYGI